METLSYVTVLLQAVAVWCDSVCDGVFQINPNRTSVIEPFGQLVQLDCSASEGAATLLDEWIIEIPEQENRNSADPSLILLPFNISTAATLDLLQLNITGTQVNNGSNFSCRGFIGQQVCTSEPITTIFFGPPSAPGDVTATENGVGVLNISWSLAAMDGVDVEFNLTVVNLNSSREPMVLTTGDMFQIVTLPDNVSCNVYQFKVTAINRAGSTSSDYITTSSPSLPVSPVEGSVQHSLMKTAEGISLRIMINNVMACPEYPVQNYSLSVDPKDDSVENVATNIAQAIGDVVNITIGGLREDFRYSYYAIATNQFGNSNPSTRVEIVTTDVQNVIICQVNSTAFTIHCIFLDGSDASGCDYTLVSREGSITGAIERSNSEGETIVVTDIAGSQLLAYDSDLILGSTVDALVVRRNICSVPMCTTGEWSPPVPTSFDGPQCPYSSTTIAMTSAVSVLITAILGTIIFVLVQVALCKCNPNFTRRGSIGQETGTSVGGEGQEYEQVDGDEKGVVASDPTYMEVGAGGGNTFQLKENEAYASTADCN